MTMADKIMRLTVNYMQCLRNATPAMESSMEGSLESTSMNTYGGATWIGASASHSEPFSHIWSSVDTVTQMM